MLSKIKGHEANLRQALQPVIAEDERVETIQTTKLLYPQIANRIVPQIEDLGVRWCACRELSQPRSTAINSFRIGTGTAERALPSSSAGSFDVLILLFKHP